MSLKEPGLDKTLEFGHNKQLNSECYQKKKKQLQRKTDRDIDVSISSSNFLIVSPLKIPWEKTIYLLSRKFFFPILYYLGKYSLGLVSSSSLLHLGINFSSSPSQFGNHFSPLISSEVAICPHLF